MKEDKTKEDKTWLLFPMLAFSKYGDGSNEISFGWLSYIYSIKW